MISPDPTIAVPVDAHWFSAHLAKEIAAGISPADRANFLQSLLSGPERVELVRKLSMVTAEEAAEMVGWTASGFIRRATQENCPSLKLGHKQPTLYQMSDVEALFDRLKVWPKGRPIPTQHNFREVA